MINLSFEEIGATLLGLDIGPNDLQGKHPSDIILIAEELPKEIMPYL